MKLLNEILEEVFPRKETGTSSKFSVVIGQMGTGKTTFARLLYSAFRTKYGGADLIYLRDTVGFLDWIEVCSKIAHRNVFFVLDDVSFSIFGITREAREFLHKFFKIRHYCYNKEKIFTTFIVHYSKSIARFIRGAHLKVLTSIDPVEFDSLAEIFPKSDLIDYYEYYTRYYHTRFIFLIRTPLRSRIVDVTLAKPPEAEELAPLATTL